MERVVAMLQGDSESELVVLHPGNVEQSLDTVEVYILREWSWDCEGGRGVIRYGIIVYGFIKGSDRAF